LLDLTGRNGDRIMRIVDRAKLLSQRNVKI
jgi:hypothetical protein